MMADSRHVVGALRDLHSAWMTMAPTHLTEAQHEAVKGARRVLFSSDRDAELSRQTKQLFQLLDQWAAGECTDETLREAVVRRRALMNDRWDEEDGSEKHVGLAGRRRDHGDPDSGAAPVRDDAAPEDGEECETRDP
ncbi:MAG: hypothetical protein HN396_04510 [Gemmatimonadales bacterium]|nr:hypothetical protein [Gemmatimonadales bacterium]